MEWWKKSVIYQIYPKSFMDSNGDGIGDIQGIISKLDYLAELGIDAIWLSPVYRSPQDDNGYDISDYKDIDPMFGTLQDMDELIAEADKRNIKIIMDLVLNHSSDEHYWFKEALKGEDNPYHDYYVWADGREGNPPNELKSAFGGSAWEYVPALNKYYLHIFSKKQPDLNWSNPKVRQELYDTVNWWTDRGIGGYRLDVIELVGKEPEKMITANGPRLHEYIEEMAEATLKGKNLITVGECWGADVERAKRYSNPDGSEFSMVFQFEHSLLDQIPGKEKWDLKELDFIELKKVLAKWQTGLYGKGWNSLFWDNHDMPRIVSRWGNDSHYRVESAKMLATVLHGMQGTPYIYQGEELGMTNASYNIEDYRDIELLNMYHERLEAGYSEEELMKSIHTKGRDNARTPMQWSSAPEGGFTEGGIKPWIKVNPNYMNINVESQLGDENSIFNYYKKLIQIRKEQEVITDGSFQLLYEEDEDIFSYMRKNGSMELVIVANFYGKTLDMPEDVNPKDGKVLIHNYGEFEEGKLRPYEAYIYERDR